MSAALRRLATAVGTPLFVRHGRGVALSKPGERMLAVVRPHLEALVAAALSPPRFDAATSEHVIRIGLSDATEGWVLPPLLRELAARAPRMAVVSMGVQFRSVVEALTSRRVDLALSVIDELPPNVRREPIFDGRFLALYDPRQLRLGARVSERAYFEQEHVIVSYNGDLRGVVEDVLGKARRVRCSLSSFSHLGDVIDGSALVATVPESVAQQLRSVRPHLQTAELPFTLSATPTPVEMLWPMALDDDEACRFVRQLVREVIERLLGEAGRGKRRSEGVAGGGKDRGKDRGKAALSGKRTKRP